MRWLIAPQLITKFVGMSKRTLTDNLKRDESCISLHETPELEFGVAYK